MSQVAVVVEVIQGATGGRYDVDIGGVGGQKQDRCGQGSPALEAGAAQKQTGRQMGEVVHRSNGKPHCKGRKSRGREGRPSPGMRDGGYATRRVRSRIIGIRETRIRL